MVKDKRVKQLESKAKQKIDEVQKVKKEQDEKILEAINIVANTSEGKTMINWLMHRCGFAVSSVTITQLGRDAVMFNEGRRAVYLDIRNKIKKNVLKNIEFMKG